MTIEVDVLLREHPSNPIRETHLTSQSRKDWVAKYAPITKVSSWTWRQDSPYGATFDGPLIPS